MATVSEGTYSVVDLVDAMRDAVLYSASGYGASTPFEVTIGFDEDAEFGSGFCKRTGVTSAEVGLGADLLSGKSELDAREVARGLITATHEGRHVWQHSRLMEHDLSWQERVMAIELCAYAHNREWYDEDYLLCAFEADARQHSLVGGANAFASMAKSCGRDVDLRDVERVMIAEFDEMGACGLAAGGKASPDIMHTFDDLRDHVDLLCHDGPGKRHGIGRSDDLISHYLMSEACTARRRVEFAHESRLGQLRTMAGLNWALSDRFRECYPRVEDDLVVGDRNMGHVFTRELDLGHVDAESLPFVVEFEADDSPEL